MGPLAVQISEPSLIQFEYLRLQLYINNAGQDRDRQAKDELPVMYFVLSMESKPDIYYS